MVMPKKEADVLKVSPFPTSAAFIQWWQDVQRRLVAASALSDEAEVAWVAKAWQNEVEMTDLGTSEGRRFESLDFKLSTAVID